MSLLQGLQLNRKLENADKFALVLKLEFRSHKDEGMRFVVVDVSLQELAMISEFIEGQLDPLLQQQAAIKAQGKCVMALAALRYRTFAQFVPVLIEKGPELDKMTFDPVWMERLKRAAQTGVYSLNPIRK